MTENCFLCNSSENITQEHVFPRWLQRKFNLGNKTILLLNGSSIKYNKIKIPCCQTCNNRYLSIIENRVKKWVEGDGTIDEMTLFKWMMKILYGLHYKETFLRNDIKDEFSESIVSPELVLHKLALRIIMLASIKNSVEFKSFVPYSIFVHNITNSSDDSFFYFDEPNYLVSSMQMGKFALNCSFLDEGIIKRVFAIMNPMTLGTSIDSHLYAEIACMVLDMKKRMQQLPDYTVERKKQGYIISTQISKAISFSSFDEMQHNQILSKYFGFYFHDLISIDNNGQEIVNYTTQLNYFKGGELKIYE